VLQCAETDKQRVEHNAHLVRYEVRAVRLEEQPVERNVLHKVADRRRASVPLRHQRRHADVRVGERGQPVLAVPPVPGETMSMDSVVARQQLTATQTDTHNDVLFIAGLVAYWPARIHDVALLDLYSPHVTSGRLAVCYSQRRSIFSSATAFTTTKLR